MSNRQAIRARAAAIYENWFADDMSSEAMAVINEVGSATTQDAQLDVIEKYRDDVLSAGEFDAIEAAILKL